MITQVLLYGFLVDEIQVYFVVMIYHFNDLCLRVFRGQIIGPWKSDRRGQVLCLFVTFCDVCCY